MNIWQLSHILYDYIIIESQTNHSYNECIFLKILIFWELYEKSKYKKQKQL